MLILREFEDGAVTSVRNVPLTGNCVTFGRSPVCTYQLKNLPAVSRVQATLKLDVDGWWVSDGSIDKYSACGVFIDDIRLDAPVPICPRLQITLFQSNDYKAVLEVVSDVTEDDLLSIDDETIEIPNVQQELRMLQRSVDDLAAKLDATVTRVEAAEQSQHQHFEQFCSTMRSDIIESVGVSLAAQIEQLSKLEPRIDAADDCNRAQWAVIRRVLIGLSVAIVGVSGVKLQQGDRDAVMRGLDLASILIGSGTIAAATKSSQKTKTATG